MYSSKDSYSPWPVVGRVPRTHNLGQLSWHHTQTYMSEKIRAQAKKTKAKMLFPIFFHFIKNMIMGTQKNSLSETVLLSSHDLFQL